MGLPTDPLSHAGLSVALVFILDFALRRMLFYAARLKVPSRRQTHPMESGSRPTPPDRARKWNIDYRLVIIGSLLPDLMDRPLSLWFFPEVFSPPERSFGHTLVFNYLFIGFSIMMAHFLGSLGPLVLSVTCAGHLLFDRMWESPQTLYWPMIGIQFGGAEHDLSPSWLHWTQTVPGEILFDGAGALVLVLSAFILYRKRTLFQWLKTGLY